jgi:hypothetical protein
VEEVTAPAITFAVAPDWPAGIEMLAGSGRAVVPPESVTVAPLAGAAAVSATVIVTVEPGATVEGVADTEFSAAGADLTSDQSAARVAAFTEPRPVA